MIWLSSIGFAFFVTMSVVFPARTMQYPKWFWGTLLINYIACVVTLHFIKLPGEVLRPMGLFSFAIGVILLLLRNKLREFEKRSGEA